MSQATLKKEYLEAELICTAPAFYNYSKPLPGTSLTLHQVLMVLGGSMGIISVLIATYLLLGHLLHYTRPKEQHQQLRIILFVIVLTVTSFLSLTFPDRSGWISPIGDCYESFAISALYLFYCQIIVAPDGTPVEVTFAKVKQAIVAAHAGDDAKKVDLGWVRITWFLVLQIAVTRIATLVANEILYGTTCPLSTTRSHGSIAIIVIQGLCTGFAVVGVIGLERRTRKTFLKGERPLFKLISFKAIIGLQSVQQIIFTALTATKAFTPSPPYYISYNDFSRGLPYILFMFEMFLVAIMFLWSFNFDRYRGDLKSGAVRHSNPLAAFLRIFIPLDMFKALLSGFEKTTNSSPDNDLKGS